MNGNGTAVSPNIDTTIREIRFKRRDKKTFVRKIDSLAGDDQKGLVERIITEAIEDCRGRPVMRPEELAGFCKMCEKGMTAGDEVECEGKCGGMLCRFCYRKDGAHEIEGRRYCKKDYGWAWFGNFLARIFGSRRQAGRTDSAQQVQNQGMPVLVRRVLVADPRMMQEVPGNGFARRGLSEATLEQSGTDPREASGRVRLARRQI